MDLVTGVLIESLAGFGGEEEILAVARHPGSDTQFGVPVAGRGVDMIDAVCEEDVEHTVRLGLGGAAECRRPKERDRAHMSGASKRSFLNHGVLLSSDDWAVTIRVVTMDTLGVSMWHLVMVGYRRQEGRVKSG